MSTRELIKQTPGLVECVDADRFSRRNTMIFDFEVENPESEFAFRGEDQEGDRLATLEIPAKYIKNQKMYDAVMRRVRISMLASDKAKGRISPIQEVELDAMVKVTQSNLEAGNANEEKIESILPLDVARSDIWS